MIPLHERPTPETDALKQARREWLAKHFTAKTTEERMEKMLDEPESYEDHARSLEQRCHMLREALQAEFCELTSTDGRTHWEGCESVHRECASVKRIKAALAATKPNV